MLESIVGIEVLGALGIPNAVAHLVSTASGALLGLPSVVGLAGAVLFGTPIGNGSPTGIAAPLEFIQVARTESTAISVEQSAVIAFDDVSGLLPGSPVVVNGQIAGKVERIATRQAAGADNAEIETICKKGVCTQKSEPNFAVGIKLEGTASNGLRHGTIGIITSPSGKDQLSAVELLVPQEGAPINLAAPIYGFSSFEKFWTSDGLL